MNMDIPKYVYSISLYNLCNNAIIKTVFKRYCNHFHFHFSFCICEFNALHVKPILISIEYYSFQRT